MARYITFVGTLVTVEAPADTPEQDVAGMARTQFMDNLANIKPHDVGVSIEGVDLDG